MPRIDDYINARNLAVEKLSQEPFEVILKRSGFESPDADTFRIPFLDRIYRVGFPLFEFEDMNKGKKEIPLSFVPCSSGRLRTESGNWAHPLS